MTPDELWVICDMLTEKEKAAEAVGLLERWLRPSAEIGDVGNDSTVVIPPSRLERIQSLASDSGLSKDEQMKLFGTLTGNLTDVLRSDDEKLARLGGLLLSAFAEASSRMVGNEPQQKVLEPSQTQANRLADLLETIRPLAYQGWSGVGGFPTEPRLAPGIEAQEEDELVGGIFSGSIFGDAGHRDDEDL